jgi:Major Facilitator Superfamily
MSVAAAGLNVQAEGLPKLIIATLGLTQIVGYGTLYYSFSILAPDMGREFGWSDDVVFGLFSAALMAGGFASAWIGKLLDRFGASRMMAWGSVVSAMLLALTALAPNPVLFGVGVVASEVVAGLVLYQAAFAALVEIAPRVAGRSITYLTLMAGFASSLFWPFTTWLHGNLDWREVYLLFAALNLGLCAPAHLFVVLRRRAEAARGEVRAGPAKVIGVLKDQQRAMGYRLAAAAFTLQGFTLSAMLVHMVPLLTALGLGAAAVSIGVLFGPSQVLSRLINMVFGARLSPLTLSLVSGLFMASAVVVLLVSGGGLIGAGLFAICLGIGSGINSIAAGALPLWLFGSDGYGEITGRMSGWRLGASAAAPYIFSLLMHWSGPTLALGVMAGIGFLAAGCFLQLKRLL